MPSSDPDNVGVHVLSLATAAVLLAAGVFAMLGGTPWIATGVLVAAWVLALGSRFGYVLAAANAVLVAVGALLGSLLISAALSGSMVMTSGLALLVAGVPAVALLYRRPPGSLRRPSMTWRDAAACCFGLFVWISAVIACGRLPLSERLGWVMRNDSLNNLIGAHEILRAHGVLLGSQQNPAPLPEGLIALGIAAGRPSPSAELSLQHDLIGMGLTWAALIGLLSLLMGLTAVAIVRAAVGSGISSHLAGVGGSALALSWYVTGYPIEYGFVNFDVAVPVLLAAILLALHAERAPWLAASGLMVASTLVLAAWSPLVVVPLGLLTLVIVWYRRALFASGSVALAVFVGSAAQLLAYAIFGALPSYLAQSSALADNGGIYDQKHAIVFVAGAGVIILAFFVFRKSRARLLISVGVVATSWLGLGVLLYLNRRNPTVWSYYPIKLAFFVTVLFLAMATGLALAFLAQLRRRRTLFWGGAVVVAAAIVSVLTLTPPVYGGLPRYNPIVRLIVSHPSEGLGGEYALVAQLAQARSPVVLWGTKERLEPLVDVWLLQLWDDSLSDSSKLRGALYKQLYDHSTKSLCTVSRLLGSRTMVYTTDNGLSGRFAVACPGATVHFAAPPDPNE